MQRFFDLNIMQKLMAVMAVTLTVFLLGNIFVVSKVDQIGQELEGIVTNDMSIVKKTTDVVIHQLEQAVVFEQAVRLSNSGARETLDKFDEFDALTKKVDKELGEIAQLATAGIGNAHTKLELDEFTKIQAEVGKISGEYADYEEHVQSYFDVLRRGNAANRSDLLEKIEREEKDLVKSLTDLVHEIEAFTEQAIVTTASHEKSVVYILIASFIAAAVASFVLFLLVARNLSNNVRKGVDLANAMAQGDFAAEIKVANKDETGELLLALQGMKTNVFERLEKDLEESARIKSALDVCDTNVMMADADFNIVYMNDSVQKMMQSAESDLKKDLPNLDASNLLGQNIDVFHKNPAHQRGMIDGLREVYRGRIKVGGRTFGLIATPIFNDKRERLGTVVEWDDMTERLAQEAIAATQAAENARIKVALDSVTANVMMADADRNIIYANDAVLDTLRNAQDDLRKELPNFNVDNLMGGSIDQFHKNPQHQMSMLDRLTGTHKATIEVGGRHMALIVNPVLGEDGERLGSVVEWADKTAEVAIEREMDGLIAAANDGDLRSRIELDNKTGFFRTLSEGLNTLLDKTGSFVSDMSAMFEAMADGDLTKSISNDYRGEFDLIKTNANNTVAKLTEVMTKVQNASGSVRTSSSEVAQGSDDLSRRTESQASSLEETASSMEQITSTVKQTSDNANQANTLASEAKVKAESGGQVVEDAVKAMAEILESSNKINDIIGVIDEIAFQTNLLALNAAVEAARAGEQGRGFAVVAGEVRTLSQRSAAAAKEIKDLIRDSVNKVESGSVLVNQSGETLADIVSAVEKVAVMIQDVSNAAREQNSGISQINQAIAQMDEMTQQNAALVEETSAASRAMSEEATNMNNLISFFRLGGSGAAMAGYSAPTAASEPIMTYQPSAASAPAPQMGNSSAASFSEDDDWEDF